MGCRSRRHGVHHPQDAYEPPQHDHGTHVAGVLAANWVEMPPSGPGEPSLPTDKLMGICPELQLWDMRVLGAQGGDEFSVVAGLKLVEAINRRARRLIVHGVNLSLALHHDVANYACGYTPSVTRAETLSTLESSWLPPQVIPDLTFEV
jgi:serine protease AprX